MPNFNFGSEQERKVGGAGLIEHRLGKEYNLIEQILTHT